MTNTLIPEICGLEFLKPQYTMRFSVKLHFSNGETKIYSFYNVPNKSEQEVVRVDQYIFTDKIFSNGVLRDNSLCFINGLSLSADFLYENSKILSEAKQTNEIVYKDDKYKLKKTFEWKAVSLYFPDNIRHPLKVYFDAKKTYDQGYATYCNWDGSRFINMDFGYISNFGNGLANVLVRNEQDQSFYFLNEEGNLAFRANYDIVGDFHNGFAKVCKLMNGDKLYGFINIDGQEVIECKYHMVDNFNDGLGKVSTRRVDESPDAGQTNIEFMLHYYSDHKGGCWGWINSQGEEVIKPQYIFTLADFSEGLCGVCKGEFYTEEDGRLGWKDEKWGFIDKTGNEVIPFIYNEVDDFHYGLAKAHIGEWYVEGQKRSGYGLIDKKGKWVLPPIYGDIGYFMNSRYIEIYDDDSFKEETVLIGLYNLELQKIVFEPQFREIEYLSGDLFDVVFADDPQQFHGIIDINGKIVVEPRYRGFGYPADGYVSVYYGDEGNYKKGLIDLSGNEIIPPIYNIPLTSYFDMGKFFAFIENGKVGIRNWEQDIIITPKFDEIIGENDLLIQVGIGEKINRKWGLIDIKGNIILPIEYDQISKQNTVYIAPKNNISYLFELIPDVT